MHISHILLIISVADESLNILCETEKLLISFIVLSPTGTGESSSVTLAWIHYLSLTHTLITPSFMHSVLSFSLITVNSIDFGHGNVFFFLNL